MTRRFDNNEQWLVVMHYQVGKRLHIDPMETQPTEDKARRAVDVLNKADPPRNTYLQPNYGYIPNPRFMLPANGCDYAPQLMGNTYHRSMYAEGYDREGKKKPA